MLRELPEALASFAGYNQFVIFKVVAKSNGKLDKIPVSLTDGSTEINAHDPRNWTDAQTAIQAASRYGQNHGVGFSLTERDPFWFLDIDSCLQADNTWSPTAIDLLNRFPGAAVEISWSGTGLHVFGVGTTPEHGTQNKPLGIEFYHKGRFVALTGRNIIGDAWLDHSAQLERLVTELFPPKTDGVGAAWTNAPVPEWSGPEDDDMLIEKALRSVSASAAFKGGVTFKDLWENNVEALADKWPDPSPERDYDANAADAALAQHLAFWTGKDCDRILRLMWRSGLARDKWKSHRTYLTRFTIPKAVALQEQVYTGGDKSVKHEPVKGVTPIGKFTEAELTTDHQFLGPAQQLEYFTGCVYVQKIDKVLTPEGVTLTQSQFKSTYGGYIFSMDPLNEKTTKNAWEAFTQSQAVRNPKVNDAMFRPDLKPGAIFNTGGKVVVNNYVPIETPKVSGDPTPFIQHLEKVLPNQRDRDVFTAYMAACVQHKGEKFQWAPLLQGVEGNGKTLFSRCVAEAIGMRYVSSPRAQEIGNRFNTWMKDVLFVYVEDVYYPEHRRDIIETLKPLITNEYQAVEPKGVDQELTYVVANFMLNSNHKDAIKKSVSDRRYAIFYSAQQETEDLARDGMGGDYFPNLYAWLKGEGEYASLGFNYGYRVVANYLENYDIPDELNPATKCHRAPATSSNEEVFRESLGGVEQEILKAIDEERVGFRGGWVSSKALDRLLDELNVTRRFPPNKRRALLQSLGYDWHPALPNGRVNNTIPVDGGKPRLFIKKGHILSQLRSQAEVAKKYAEAQLVGSQNSTDAADNETM